MMNIKIINNKKYVEVESLVRILKYYKNNVSSLETWLLLEAMLNDLGGTHVTN